MTYQMEQEDINNLSRPIMNYETKTVIIIPTTKKDQN
jgi:hypothetical protein